MKEPIADINMKENLIGGLYFPFSFEKHGEVELAELEGDELEEAKKHGGDGSVVILKNGANLRVNSYRARCLRPKNNEISLFLRAFVNEKEWGSLFYSDFLGLSIHDTGLAIAYLGVTTPEGKLYREIPLGMIKRGKWSNFFFVVGNGQMKFYCNDTLVSEFPFEQKIVAPFDDDLAIGVFRSPKPDTYGTSIGHTGFKNLVVDTVKVWDRAITQEEVEKLGGYKISVAEESVQLEMCRNYNALFDASMKRDVALCKKYYDKCDELARLDVTHPEFHLVPPAGHLFDPCGAFYYDGKYHVFSYHNLLYLLEFASLDHYVSEDLLNWTAYPMGPLADSEHDVFCIYLMNHFIDDDGKVRILYTGQGYEGKRGIMAESNDNLVSYVNKRAAITKYHHDGHVFKHGNTWYTITSHLTKGQHPECQGDPVMLWSSSDLENWTEEGIMFETDGFMEFPYLLTFGDKDVMILGGYKQRYWVGKMDWEAKKFIPDNPIEKRIDQTNHFHCFNPLCVDNKGENGAQRRIVMALYSGESSNDPIFRGGVHLLPRELTLCGDYLKQMPIPETKKARRNYIGEENIVLNEEIRNVKIGTGNCFEANAEFSGESKGRCGIKIKDADNEAVLYFDTDSRNFGVDGTLRDKGEGPSYIPAGEDFRVNVFCDKWLVEVFVNGQVCSTAILKPLSENTEISVFCEGSGCVTKADFWIMKTE